MVTFQKRKFGQKSSNTKLDIKENIDSIFDSALEISQESVEIYSQPKIFAIIFHR